SGDDRLEELLGRERIDGYWFVSDPALGAIPSKDHEPSVARDAREAIESLALLLGNRVDVPAKLVDSVAIASMGDVRGKRTRRFPFDDQPVEDGVRPAPCLQDTFEALVQRYAVLADQFLERPLGLPAKVRLVARKALCCLTQSRGEALRLADEPTRAR